MQNRAILSKTIVSIDPAITCYHEGLSFNPLTWSWTQFQPIDMVVDSWSWTHGRGLNTNIF